VWRGTECIGTLEGHSKPVLSLAVTPEGEILSGSGDTTIKRWAGGKCVQTYTGHTDTVRCEGAAVTELAHTSNEQ
jgi:phospholipase A-2-activating protein